MLQYQQSVISQLPRWPSLYASLFPGVHSSSSRGRTRRTRRSAGRNGDDAGLAVSSGEHLAPHAVFALHACDTATDEAAAPKEEPEVKAEAAEERTETKAEPEVKVEAADTSGVEVVVKEEPADA